MDLDNYVDETFGEVTRVPGRHGYDHYVPRPRPRALDLDQRTTGRYAGVLSASFGACLPRTVRIGRLAGAGRLLTNPHLLVEPYLATEALASSRIEGTQASLTDVLEAAADPRTPTASTSERSATTSVPSSTAAT